MNFLQIVVSFVLFVTFFSCAPQEDDTFVAPPTQGQNGTNPLNNSPVLDNGQYSPDTNAKVSFDSDSLPAHLVDRYDDGTVTQLDSIENLFQFELDGSTNASQWDTTEPRPMKMKFGIEKANHIGEYNLIVSNTTGKSVIVTVEPLSGSKVFAKLNLTESGFGTTSSEVTDITGFDVDLNVPVGVVDPIPVILFVCLDANDNGRCNDERIKNLNFYINQVDPEIVDEEQIQQELSQILASDIDDEQTKNFSAGNDSRGIIYYAQNAILDPVKSALFDYKSYSQMAGQNFNRFGGFAPTKSSMAIPSNDVDIVTSALKYMSDATGDASTDDSASDPVGTFENSDAINSVFSMVDDMLKSEQANFTGVEQILAEDETPQEISIPLVKYQQGVYMAVQAGEEFTEAVQLPTGEETGGALNSGELVETGFSDEVTTGPINTNPIENSDGVITCSQVCTCTANGVKICTPVQGKEELIGRCNESCRCVQSGSIQCSRDPRVNGCFVKGTMIKIAKDSYAPIETIMPETYVIDGANRKRKVMRIVDGPEKNNVYYLTTTTNRILGVSGTHPILTKGGLKMAKELSIEDLLIAEDGKAVGLKGIEKRPYDADVYNFVLDSAENEVRDHLLISEGIVTGDLYLQKKLSTVEAKVSRK